MNRDRQRILTQAATAHRQSLRQSLQRRLEAAKAKGNLKLVGQLEAEAYYLKLK
ncbi:MAG: hypothetical protein ACFB4I_14075 [Cyanophyceae cyanobacterium]